MFVNCAVVARCTYYVCCVCWTVVLVFVVLVIPDDEVSGVVVYVHVPLLTNERRHGWV